MQQGILTAQKSHAQRTVGVKNIIWTIKIKYSQSKGAKQNVLPLCFIIPGKKCFATY